MGLESIIRPFMGQDVSPTRIQQPGAVGVPPVLLAIGRVGGTKTFSTTYNYSMSSYMVEIHDEKKTNNYDIETGKATE